MKNIFTTIALMLCLATTYAQKQWSLELGVGNHSIADEVADSQNQYVHLDGVLRYSFNDKFGVGLYTGYDNLKLENFITSERAETQYYRASIEAVIDVFEVASLYSKHFNILAHGGPGITYFDTQYGSQTVANLSGGVTGLVKITKSLAVKADWTTTAQLNQDITLNGTDAISNVGINSFVNNITVGAVIYFGKKHNSTTNDHYDWTPPVQHAIARDTVYIQPTVIDKTVTNNIASNMSNDCNCKVDEYVFFENDKYNITKEAYRSIVTIAESLKDNEMVYLTGSASPPASDEYNQTLSDNRCKTIRALFVSAGVPESRIENLPIGEVDTVDGKHVELSRRVRIQVKTIK